MIRPIIVRALLRKFAVVAIVLGVGIGLSQCSVIPGNGLQSGLAGHAGTRAVSSTGFSDTFDDGNALGWSNYDGLWSVNNGQYMVTSSAGGKAVAGQNFADLSFEADVKVGSTGNAGLIFRASNPSVGADNFSGYYVGIDAGAGRVQFGKMNNSWTELKTAALSIAANSFYHIKVVALGSNIKIFVADMGSAKIDLTDTSFAAGDIGFRTYNTAAAFDNASALPATLSSFSDTFDSVSVGKWSSYDGTWSINNGQYSVTAGPGYKSLASGSNFSGCKFEADVAVGGAGNAGIIFRVSNPSSGADNFSGYYLGIDAGAAMLVLGKMNNNWTPLASYSMPILSDTFYHLKVQVSGSYIWVYFGNQVVPTLFITDSQFSSGAIGLRSFNTNARFDNVTVSSDPGITPVISPFSWGAFASATVLSTTKHNIGDGSQMTQTYRSYFKPRESGNFIWKFWDCNVLDSTRADGAWAYANLPGGSWRIEAAYIADGGLVANGATSGTPVRLTFGGNGFKDVSPGEKFWTDPAALAIPPDHLIAFTWSITPKSSGKVIPYNCETLTSAYIAPGNVASQLSAASFANTTGVQVLPCLIGYQKAVSKRIAFLGDSITQGVNTSRDGYAFWSAKIAAGLGPNYAVWNLGSGWARASDSASDGAWLFKAKQSDEINICLGVNDIGTANRNTGQILADLSRTIGLLKQNNPACRIILFTVPPFNFSGTQADTWRSVNNGIRSSPPAGTDRVFDIAAVLSQPSPNENLLQNQYMTSDAHPNDAAGSAVANAYLNWY